MTEKARPPAAPDLGGGTSVLAEALRLQLDGRLDEAEAAYASLLASPRVDPIAWVNAGALALARGDIAVAIVRLERAVATLPASAIARNNLGFALIGAGRYADALAALDSAIALKPAYAEAHNNRGIALVRMARGDDAIGAFEQALALKPDYVAALVNLGDRYRLRGNWLGARAAYQRALALAPGEVAARVGDAFAEALGGDLDASIAHLECIVAEVPDSALAWQNLGAVRNWAWRHEDARVAFRRALDIDPSDAHARFGVASTLLAQGRYGEGFAAFEQRAEGVHGNGERFPDLPVWNGAPFSGTLLVYAEQGLGDIVQFCRFVPLLRPRVGRIVLFLEGYWACLAPLMESLRGVDRIATTPEALSRENFTARASALSLAFLSGVTANGIPGEPYLRAPADRIPAWRQRLAGHGDRTVGLAWSVTARDDHAYITQQKSIPSDALVALLDTPDVAFVTLQPGAAGDPAVLGAHSGRVADVRPHIGDFGDTAAAIAALDLVISADTAVAHVAGALGKPVWLLDRFNCCWRWRLAPHTSPWYPSMRIFRQSRFGDWNAPIAEVREALRDFVQAGGK